MLAVRRATPDDVEGIACLHVDSWRRSYRGAYSDEFLDADILPDRLDVWRERVAAPAAGRFTVVAELDGAVVGFVHVILDEEPGWAVVQNIHVAPELHGQGIGARLLGEAGRALAEERAAQGLAVWVREENTAARRFYEARGATCTERKLGGPFADGSRAPVLRYVWADPAVL